MKRFKLLLILLSSFLAAGLVSCASTPEDKERQPMGGEQLATGENDVTGEIVITAPEQPFSLDLGSTLADNTYTWEFVENEDNDYYKITNVVYVENANFYEWATSNFMGVTENKAYIQSMNIFVPAAYVDGIDGDGSLIINNKSVNGYTAATAPVLYENGNAGYLTGQASDIITHFGDNTIYLKNGFVYISVGSRGRDIASSPASIVDLKAGIRFIRLNSELIPGDKDKIVSVGTSGGGAMSSLVGATGNMDEYYSYLYSQGSAGIEESNGTYKSTINDDVFAAQLYCPIADLENADLAYAWIRYNSSMNGEGARAYSFTEYQSALEKDMASAYVDYLNSLELADADGNSLTLESEREGSFYDAVLNEISKALNAYVDAEAWNSQAVMQGMGKPMSFPYKGMTEQEWFNAQYGDTSSWLTKDSNGDYKVTDIDAFFQGTNLNRNKEIPGFDDLEREAEGNAFSETPMYHAHFSQANYNVMKDNDADLSQLDGYTPEYLTAYNEANNSEIVNRVYLYSAMQILADEDQSKDVAKHWRMRNGTADEHTSFSVNYNIGLTLNKYFPDVTVDYALVWNMPHGAMEGSTAGTLTEWVNSICK